MGEKERELEQDARIALLGHYSSKSTNQTIILLTEAFVFFTFVGLFPSTLVYRDYFVIVIAGLFIYLASYAFGRLINWAEHASAILNVKMTDDSEMKNALHPNDLGLPKSIEMDKHSFTLDFSLTRLQSLSVACDAYLIARKKSGKSRLIKGYYFFQSLKWKLLIFAVTLVAFIIRIALSYYV